MKWTFPSLKLKFLTFKFYQIGDYEINKDDDVLISMNEYIKNWKERIGKHFLTLHGSSMNTLEILFIFSSIDKLIIKLLLEF